MTERALQDVVSGRGGARVGEVVGASTTELVVHCYELYEAPPLGALVRCGTETAVYGVVGEVSTQSLDPGRMPVAMGADEESEEDVYRRNPQLGRLLSTTFRAVVVGHRADRRIDPYLAPLPPRIHSFAFRCDGDEVREITESLELLTVLVSSQVGSPDDVTASFLRLASRSLEDSHGFLVKAGKELATLLGGQLPRLNGLLKRLDA